MDKKKVGFVGLGNMGFPMASNLLKSGFTVYGVDIKKVNEERLAAIGGKTGYTVATLTDEVDILFTSLPTPQIVEEVYLGKAGLIHHGSSPLTFVDVSTVSPELNRKIAEKATEKNMQYLGAPVSGSVSGAEAATLTVMVGGKKEAYPHALPYLHAIGKNIFQIDEDAGMGTIVKLINNLMTGIHNQAVAESLSIADHYGLDHDLIHQIVSVSSGQSDVFSRNHKNFISQDEYRKGAFTASLLHKDLKLAKYVSGGTLPLVETLIQYFDDHMDGYADKDMSATYLMLKQLHAKKKQS
ncbi:NAD(P)-dependent oxidoreductase [Virgibacillus alimentarius]|uniref:3-hydroxyisobutyrate dehydrogenase n=1 Tax=Virgibacillus alimentarius TaxID=698769 RepID=A0ABS4SBP3_9BACI|nr:MULTISPECIES: NAD(P)-dependent oxidoreductase [Virgibacillus]MBP2258440.1 3-hydroxyisobutyrate dehydrogenase [Virgibacillus alimentarius]HLR68219.1 NAD(P)-dependent oxidoreductase [Virgibacillus sp.]